MTSETDDRITQIKHRWRGVYAVDGIGKVGIGELPPDIAWLLDEHERMHTALEEIASQPCNYLFHGDEDRPVLDYLDPARHLYDPDCPGEVCTAKRGLGEKGRPELTVVSETLN